MKRIIILLVFLSQMFFMFSLDVEKEKGSLQQIIKEIISKSESPFENNDSEDYIAFDSKITKISSGEEKFSEPLKYKKSLTLDINKDGKNDLKETVEFNLNRVGQNFLSLSITALFDIENYEFQNETVQDLIKIKKSKIKVLIKSNWNELQKEEMKMSIEISGDADYTRGFEVKASFNISGDAGGNGQMPEFLNGKIKINNNEYDYQMSLSSLGK